MEMGEQHQEEEGGGGEEDTKDTEAEVDVDCSDCDHNNNQENASRLSSAASLTNTSNTDNSIGLELFSTKFIFSPTPTMSQSLLPLFPICRHLFGRMFAANLLLIYAMLQVYWRDIR